MEIDIIKPYTITLDDIDKTMIDNRIAEKGINKFLSQQLVYLDCSRVVNGMRMMQTIGYPYRREISIYLYAIDKIEDKLKVRDLIDRLLALHALNLAYEKGNPPIWYGGKKAKDKWDREHSENKLPRRRKVKEQTIAGMGRELSNRERLKRLSAQFGNLTFKIKPTKEE